VDGETGQLVWSETYSTPQSERLVAAACDQDGNLYAVGRAFGTGYFDIVVQKYAGDDGHNVWTRSIASDASLDDVGWDIAVDSQGRPVVCGMVGTTPSTADVVVAAFDPVSGLEDWRELVPGAVANPEVIAGWVAVASDDDVILGTRTWSSATGYDLVLRRYTAADGDVVWARQWNSSGAVADDPRALALDAAGDVLLAGVSGGDYLVAKFAGATGEPVWQGHYAGPPDWYDVATCLAVAPDGTVVASGYSDGSGTGWDVATVGFAPADGSRVWSLRFDGHGESDEARALAIGPAGDVLVAGYCYSYESGYDLLALCYAAGAPTQAPAIAAPPAVELDGAWPNPFNPRVTLAFTLPRPGPVRVAVCDSRGREVAVLADGPRPAGLSTVDWDGRDGAGRALPSGLYVAVVEAAGHRSSRKLTLLR